MSLSAPLRDRAAEGAAAPAAATLPAPPTLRGPGVAVVLARETALGMVPALVGLLLLAAFVEAAWWVWLLALLLAALSGLALARLWVEQAGQLARWLGGLDGGPPAERPVAALYSALEWVMWPALELTQRRARAERRLRSGERLLDTVLEALPDPLFLVDSRMVLRRVNQAARRAFDLPPGELPLGRAIRDPAILAAVNSALAGGIGDSAVYNPVSDRLKVFAARVEPVDLGEEGRGALIALREQTEQLMIERMRSDFVANASHEMRTPLASIIGFIETMRGPARNDVAARDAFLVTMAEEAARMQRLVEDLLSLSRIELAEHKPPEHEVELTLLIDQVRGALAPMAERAGMAIEVELAAALPAVRGDRDQLHQLLSNLVDNALKYATGGKRVRIEGRAWSRAPAEAGPLSGEPSLALSVIDFGEGIPRELIPRVTERFFRIDKARSRRIGGTGLGLAIVKHIVRRHRGQLVIESELGHGSRFTVYLPVQSAAAT